MCKYSNVCKMMTKKTLNNTVVELSFTLIQPLLVVIELSYCKFSATTILQFFLLSNWHLWITLALTIKISLVWPRKQGAMTHNKIYIHARLFL